MLVRRTLVALVFLTLIMPTAAAAWPASGCIQLGIGSACREHRGHTCPDGSGAGGRIYWIFLPNGVVELYGTDDCDSASTSVGVATAFGVGAGYCWCEDSLWLPYGNADLPNPTGPLWTLLP